MRKIGPLNKSELKAFQKRHKATVDGKFGHQSMGIVLGVESDRDYYKAAYDAVKDSPDTTALVLITGSIAFFAGFALAAMFA